MAGMLPLALLGTVAAVMSTTAPRRHVLFVLIDDLGYAGMPQLSKPLARCLKRLATKCLAVCCRCGLPRQGGGRCSPHAGDR